LANRSVALDLRTKIKKTGAQGKVPEWLTELACGEYYLSWNIKRRKRLEPVGNDHEAALNARQTKRLEWAYVAAGGEIKQPDNKRSESAIFDLLL
jgi:hypothetical protein